MSAKRWKFLSVLLLALSFVLLPLAGAEASSGQFSWLDTSTGWTENPVKMVDNISAASMAIDASNNAYVCGVNSTDGYVYLNSTSSSFGLITAFDSTSYSGCDVAISGNSLFAVAYNDTNSTVELKKFDLSGHNLLNGTADLNAGAPVYLQMLFDEASGYLALVYYNSSSVYVAVVDPSDLNKVADIDTGVDPFVSGVSSKFKAVLNDSGVLAVCGFNGTDINCNVVNLALKTAKTAFGVSSCNANATSNFELVTDGSDYYVIYSCDDNVVKVSKFTADGYLVTVEDPNLYVTGTVDSAAYVSGDYIALAWNDTSGYDYFNLWKITESGYQVVNYQNLNATIQCSYLTPMDSGSFACVGSNSTAVIVKYITEETVGGGWSNATIAWSGVIGSGDTVLSGVNNEGIVTVLFKDSTPNDAWVAQFKNTPKYDLYFDPTYPPTLLNADLYPGRGDNVTLQVVDKVCSNSTSELASPETKVEYFLSKDASYNDTDVKIGERVVPSLTPGSCEDRIVYTELTVSSEDLLNFLNGTASAYVIACVNNENKTTEINDGNNCVSLGSFTAYVADLTGSVDAPDEIEPGSNVTVSVSLNNTGTDDAGAFVVKFYLTKTGDIEEGTYLGEKDISSLAAGSSDTEDVQLSIPATIDEPAYTMHICAKIDANDQVTERDEDNNVACDSFTLKAPNLRVSSVNIVGSDYTPGDVVSYNFTIENSGLVGASNVEWEAYLSTKSDCSEIVEVVDNGTYTGTLDNGTSVTITSSFEYPEKSELVEASSVYLCVMVDPNYKIQEFNEDDNIGETTISTGSGPDLTVTSIIVSPPHLRTCDGGGCTGATVEFVVKNQGEGDAGPFVCNIYLSSDDVLNPDEDILIGNKLISGLAAGSMTLESVSAVIPAGTPDGQYYVLVQVDSNNDVDELLENNNVAYKQITIGNVSQGGGQAQPVPSSKQIGPANPAEAPVQSSNGQISGNFSYQGNVDIAVGFITCDFSSVYWYDPNSGTMTTTFAHSGLVTNFSFSNVALPDNNGYVFWLVTGGVDISQLDFSNDPYLLQFYMVGSCD